MQHVNKKTIIIIATVVVLIIAGVASLFWVQRKPTSHRAARECSAYGPTTDYFDGPASIQEMANDSITIVKATVENPDVPNQWIHRDAPEPSIKVTEVLKGDVRVNDILSVCAGMGYVDLLPGEHPTIVLFAEGKDGSTWIPVWGWPGIAPQGKDGRFTPKGLGDEPQSFSIDELRGMVK